MAVIVYGSCWSNPLVCWVNLYHTTNYPTLQLILEDCWKDCWKAHNKAHKLHKTLFLAPTYFRPPLNFFFNGFSFEIGTEVKVLILKLYDVVILFLSHCIRDGHTHWVMDIQPYPIQLFWVIPNSLGLRVFQTFFRFMVYFFYHNICFSGIFVIL